LNFKKSESNILSPIIIIGPGRSGSTIFFEAISKNKKIGWLSNYYYITSKLPQIGLMHRFFKNNIGQKHQGQNVKLYNQFLPRPLEVFPVWESIFGKKFSTDSLHMQLPSNAESKNAISFFEKLLKWQNKERLCIKLTGPPRMYFLNKVFKDATFIDVVRNPIATVYSLMNIKYRAQNKNVPFWTGLFTEHDILIWEKYGKTQLAQAALELKNIYRITEIERMLFGGKYIRVKYEDFILNPLKTIDSILNDIDLETDDSIKYFISNFTYQNKNIKSNNYFCESEKQIIKDICTEQMEEMEYN